MFQQPSLKRRIWLNEQLPCTCFIRCNNLRYQLSSLCQRHNQVRFRWCDPRFKCIYRSKYKAELETIQRIVKINKDHPEIKKAILFFDQFLTQAENTLTTSGPFFLLKHLKGQGVSGVSMLIEVAACWLYSERNTGIGNKTVFSMDNREAFIGSRVLALAPKKAEHLQGVEMSGKARASIGSYVKQEIGSLIYRLADAGERSDAKAKEKRRQEGANKD